MASMVIIAALAATAGMLGAVLGVRDLKKKTVITIERGKPRGPLPSSWESAVEGAVASPQADLGF